MCVCLCVFACLYECMPVSVCVKCVCVCSSNSTAGNKGQLKSQHIVSLETRWKNNKRPKKNLLNFSCLFQLFSFFFSFFLDLKSFFSRSLTAFGVRACVIKALQLFRASVSPLVSVLVGLRSSQVEILAFVRVYLRSISGSEAGGRNEAARSSYFLPVWLFD